MLYSARLPGTLTLTELSFTQKLTPSSDAPGQQSGSFCFRYFCAVPSFSYHPQPPTYMNIPPDTDYTRLHNAAATGDVETLRACIAAGDPVNYVAGHNSRSALCRAVMGGHEEAVRLLIEAGADVNVRKDIILHQAVQGKSEHILRMLLEAGADVNAGEPLFGDTPLLWSVSFCDSPFVRILLEYGANPNARSGYFGSLYALHTAAMTGDRDVLRLLLAAGARVNQFADEGTWTTPLHICAEEALPLLLEAGADVNAAAAEGVTALHAAAYRGELGIARTLLAAGAQVDATLREADESGVREHDMAFRLPTGDESAYYCDEYVPIGSTPLHLAALQGHMLIVELLLAHGANPQARTQAGASAQELIWAARQKDTTKRLPHTNTLS